MKAILLRSRKDPFSVRSAEETVERDLIGGNAGNLLFLAAAHKLLSVPGREIVPDGFRFPAGAAGRINERYEAYVIPLANAFRPTFQPILDRMTGLIRRLRIPVTVLGVGAQADLSGDWSWLAPIERSVREFVAAILDHGPSIGVRGEITAAYLRSLGFRDVEVVGCPSMFLWGDRLRVDKATPTLDPDARVSITISPYVRAMGPIVTRHLERFPHLGYVAQDLPTLDKLVWGETADQAALDDPVPIHLSHRMFQEDRVRMYLDPWPWITDLREVDFSFGTRIHGTIAAIVAGRPAVALAHDSRTLELARYFGIPHRQLQRDDLEARVDAGELYAAADFAGLNDGHAARWATFAGYMARHGLDNVFAHSGAPAAWDARATATGYPPAVRATYRDRPRDVPQTASRAGWRLYRALRLTARRVLRRDR